LRFISPGSGNQKLHVTAMNPGSKKLNVKCETEKNGVIAITVSGVNIVKKTIRLSPTLKLKR
jgi:hypothetical protein